MDKILIVIVVYNRLENLRLWVKAWEKCEKHSNAELIVIHNRDKEEHEASYRSLCESNAIKYIPRQNVGMDIGALQDVFRGRLEGFPNEWKYLIWSTDDTIPVNPQFISKFIDINSQENVGVSCIEISKEVKPHIRTTGFCIDQETASKIQFPRETVLNKLDCYLFEHKSPSAFYEQVLKLGKKAIQISNNLKEAPLWDTGNRKHLNLWNKHYEYFPKIEKKITIISPIYNSYPQIISCLLCQTYQNWELLLLHDGKNITGLNKIVENYNDKRITYIQSEVRQHNYGHHLRKWALEEIKNNKLALNTDYILITNSDNYYTPIALEEAAKTLDNNLQASSTYFGQFVHGYMSNQKDGTYRFGVLDTKLELGWIDCGGVMVRKEVACSIGWRSMKPYSDWEYFQDIINKYGKESFIKTFGCHFSHN